MIFRWCADIVVVLHAAFVAFVVFGALLVIRRQWIAWLHVPSAVWGALIEYAGWICPLTPLENGLRARAGEAAYGGGFVEHYVLPLLYPAGLTTNIQWVLGTIVVVVNSAAYGLLVRRHYKNTHIRPVNTDRR